MRGNIDSFPQWLTCANNEAELWEKINNSDTSSFDRLAICLPLYLFICIHLLISHRNVRFTAGIGTEGKQRDDAKVYPPAE